MEQTRHFVATLYIVVDDAVALHHHEGLDLWLPAGGHVERGEAPHETALREAEEETGLSVELCATSSDLRSDTVESLPRPAELLLEDINVCDGTVGHQHVDFVYFGTADHRTIDPAVGEAPPDRWRWFTAADIDQAQVLDPDVEALSRRALDVAD